MIFLGAGASKVFGLKTLQDLTKDLIVKMEEKGHASTINDIIDSCKQFGLTPDFENIYTTLEGLANPTEGIKTSGPFAAYVTSKSNISLRKKTRFRDILIDFRDLIYRECTIRKGIVEDKGDIFGELLKTVVEYEEERFLSSKTGIWETRKINIGNTIVTTNYDVTVELYHRHTNKELADGFTPTRYEYIKKLDFKEYGRHPASQWLIKLHGSIWQFKKGEEIIQTIGPPESSPLKISVGEQMMIFPVGEKPVLKEPYYSFYSIFKEQPWNTLIAIGHSFRDQPVNIAILERLVHESKTKLLVVDPQAEDVVQNLGSLPKEVDQRIIRIPQTFEDNPRLFQRIKIAIRSSSYNDFRRRTKSFFRKIKQKDTT